MVASESFLSRPCSLQRSQDGEEAKLWHAAGCWRAAEVMHRQTLEEEGQPDEDSVLVKENSSSLPLTPTFQVFTFGDHTFAWVDLPAEAYMTSLWEEGGRLTVALRTCWVSDCTQNS